MCSGTLSRMNRANRVDLQAIEATLRSDEASSVHVETLDRNLSEAKPVALRNGMAKQVKQKAFAYLRVSGRGQVDGDGFPRQLTAIEKYATANGLKIVRVFREEGISGTTDWENRPAFSEMMAMLLNNGVHTVLVERLDRIARDLLVQESVIGDFQRKGLTLVSVSEPDLLGNDASRVLMRQMLGAFFQYEKTLLVAKLRGSRERMRKREGRCEGRKPYGDRPGESETLARMIGLRDKGLSYDAIAEKLNADKVVTRYGGTWFGSTIRKIVNAQ